MRATNAINEALDRARREGRLTEHGKPPAPVINSEDQFQEAVEALAKKTAWLLYHTRISKKSKEGFPDVVALRAGRQIIAELKMPGEKPSADQLRWLDEWRLVPAAEVFVWYPVDWPDIERILA